MKKFLFSLVFIFSLTTWANYDPIINIPDANFKAKLLAASPINQVAKNLEGQWFKIDGNNDGEIQISEALNVSVLELDCINCIGADKISSVFGIFYFANLLELDISSNVIQVLNLNNHLNLISLDCSSNQILELDISELQSLKFFKCIYNQITNLNIGELLYLEELICSFNQIAELNFNNLINLKKIMVDNNFISSLNFDNLLNLEEIRCNNNILDVISLNNLNSLKILICNSNFLTDLNLINLPLLYWVHCSVNQLNSINFNNSSEITTLTCTHNFIENIDVSSLIKLNNFQCNNNSLTTLNIKNGKNISFLAFGNNPQLSYICCDENQLATVQNKVNQYGFANCQVNTYCSFTPGGNYNTISGQFKYDFDLNGCDINDYPVLNAKLNSPSFTGSNTIYANNQGQYNGYTLQGTHTITPQIENPTFFTITPPAANVSFPNANNNTQTQNFCITPNGEQMDVEVIFTPLNPARPGFDADYKIVYRNIGNQVANGEVYLTYMSDRIDLVSSSVAPTTQTSEQLIWNYQNLLPFETRTINLTFNINSPMETPPVNNGDLLSYGAYITPLDGDINAFNNTSALRQEVVGSYDPNDKTCLQGNTPGPEFIDQYVHYLIRFENTGTFFAQNVVVRDDIDLSKFDINSLVVLDASHDMLVTRINGNRVEFIFEGIQLPFPPSELRHGYVLFKIKTKSTLVVGSTFSNQAGIYFDYNWPIITNNEVSTITLLGQPNFEFSELISLYPNPAHAVINISAKTGTNLKSIEIYNTLGQLVMAVPNSMNQLEINVSHLHSGSYFVKVHTDRGVGHTKFVKK